MSDLDLVITASGDFGTFVWEYPPDMKELLKQFAEKFGEGELRCVNELQQVFIEQLLCILVGTLMAGDKVRVLTKNIHQHLGELAEENLRILQQ